jgi:twitching motility protein PilT
MSDDNLPLIVLAERKGFITPQQARQLREELDMFPGQRVSSLLISRHHISPDQLRALFRIIESERRKEDSTGARRRSQIPGAPPAAPVQAPDPNKPGSFQAAATRPATAGQADGAGASPPASIPMPRPSRFTSAFSAQGAQVSGTLAEYLRFSRSQNCSDFHITVGRPPYVRHQGRVHYFDVPPLTADRAEALLFSALTPELCQRLLADKQVEFAFDPEGVGRHRANVYRQRLGWEGEFRIVPSTIPAFEELQLPEILRRLADHRHGLVVVTGPAGSGKTTTVATLLQHINTSRREHIITVEQPIEFVLKAAQCQVTQREVGQHTRSFATALRAAMNQDPDVIMVGDLRGFETTSIAVSAAETGHLVFGTLPTGSVTRTVGRIIGAYPSSQREQVATMLASAMRGIVSQQLVPHASGLGLAVASEVLLSTTAVGQAIRDNKTNQLFALMQSNRKLGMKTMDDSLMELFDQKQITGSEAWVRAENKHFFEAIRNQ